MKQIAKTVLKGLLIIVLFTGGSIALSTKGVKTISEANAAVSYAQVYEYLVGRGYTVNSLSEIPGKYDWTASTVKNGIRYCTTIHCTATSIIGNTDVPM